MKIKLERKAKKYLSDPPRYKTLHKKFNVKTNKIILVKNLMEATKDLSSLFNDLKLYRPEKLTNRQNQFSIRVDQAIRIHFRVSESDWIKFTNDKRSEIHEITIYDITFHEY